MHPSKLLNWRFSNRSYQDVHLIMNVPIADDDRAVKYSEGSAVHTSHLSSGLFDNLSHHSLSVS
jgi:hypothetical protein